MNAAIAIGTLLLGGWVLDPPTGDQQAVTNPVQQPSATAPMPTLPAPSNLPASNVPPSNVLDRNRQRTTTSPDAADRLRDRTGFGGQTPGTQQSRTPNQGQGQSQGQGQGAAGPLPMLPTEPLPPDMDNSQGQPTPPTANAPMTGRSGKGAGGLSTATGPTYGPMSPTAPTDRRGPWSAGYRASSSATNQQYSRAQSLGGMSVAAPSGVDKAYAGYQPTSGVSPYMNLFRRDNLGTVDNYTTLVRPQLDQRNLNQQFNRDITGLNRNAIMQGSMLQQMNNASRAPEGVGTPQFYMNSGGYYPGQ